MIQRLRVNNLAVIESLELELGPGLTALTGETGAGKSVLLQAIALLQGRRVSVDAIRSGCDEARVEAIVTNSAVIERARERGVAEVDDEELLVARTLARKGRGRVYLNGSLATVSLLREVMADCVEVTSQGEHQRLLRPDVQADLLDAYGELGELARQLEVKYADWHEVARELHARRSRREERARRADLLRYEIEQIDRVDPQAGEVEQLESEHRRLAHADRLSELCGQALEALDGEQGSLARVSGAQAALRDAQSLDPALAELLTALERAEIEMGEAQRGLESYQAGLESDSGRLQFLDARLADLVRLLDRYGSDLEAVMRYRESSAQELEGLGGGEVRRQELEAELEKRAVALRENALKLGRARRSKGGELGEAVSRELQALDLKRARFSVVFDALVAKTPEGWKAPVSPSGCERAAFEWAANPGQDLRRLRDAASGGELARLLLALRNVLRELDRESVLLFDEIDAGIGGRTAGRVGQRLRALSRNHQILCITHLAPIAALAHAHYRIEKHVRGDQTRTRVEQVTGNARVDEIARMSGSGKLSDAARAHARELLGGP